jgi:hypothetical protein
LQKAVAHVIDTCVYPKPTVANFISFDRHIKLFTYTDITGMLKEDPKAFEHYGIVKIEGIEKPMYARVEDIQRYKMEIYIPPPPRKPKFPEEPKSSDDKFKDALNFFVKDEQTGAGSKETGSDDKE